jgi:isocitrate dehydrogenase
VWPNGFKETFCTDHWRCRFKGKSSKSLSKEDIIQLLRNAIHQNVDVIKTENLYLFNGVAAYSLGQGQ